MVVVPVSNTMVLLKMFSSQVLAKVGPGEVSSDRAVSTSLNHNGLAHDVLHLGLGQGVAGIRNSQLSTPFLKCTDA